MSTIGKTDGSKLFENKQLIHIVSEVVVLIGLTFYFSSKNKKLLGHIEELAQTVEQQEDRLQKTEQAIVQLSTDIGKSLEQFARRIKEQDLEISRLNELVSQTQQDQPQSRVQTRVHSPPQAQSKSHSQSQAQSQSYKPRVSKKRVEPEPEPPRVNHISVNIVDKPEMETGNNKIEVLSNPDEEEEISESELDAELSEELAELNN